jgi:hypothetical protein
MGDGGLIFSKSWKSHIWFLRHGNRPFQTD